MRLMWGVVVVLVVGMVVAGAAPGVSASRTEKFLTVVGEEVTSRENASVRLQYRDHVANANSSTSIVRAHLEVYRLNETDDRMEVWDPGGIGEGFDLWTDPSSFDTAYYVSDSDRKFMRCFEANATCLANFVVPEEIGAYHMTAQVEVTSSLTGNEWIHDSTALEVEEMPIEIGAFSQNQLIELAFWTGVILLSMRRDWVLTLTGGIMGWFRPVSIAAGTGTYFQSFAGLLIITFGLFLADYIIWGWTGAGPWMGQLLHGRNRGGST